MLSGDYEDLTDAVHRAISLAAMREDMKPLRAIATNLSGELTSEFDDEQRAAYDVALRFMNGDADESMRISQLELLAKRLDGQTTRGGRENEKIDRLLFTALNTQTPFDAYGADFLIHLCWQLGLPCGRVKKAFSEFVKFEADASGRGA